MNKIFWKNKKVLITGHTGIKGSWLSLWLQNKKSRLIGYSLAPPTEPNLFELAHIGQGMISITGDVRDSDYVRFVIEQHKPEIIFHMAAQALVRHSYKDPTETYSTNIMGTVNVLDAVRHSSDVRVVIVVTSDKCYMNHEWLWGYRESDPIGGHDPYSSSKACAELVTLAYRNSYFSKEDYGRHGVALASARAGNIVAGGDWAKDRLIPDSVKAFMANRLVKVRNPNALRPWQYVLEPLKGYLCLAEKLWEHGPDFAEAWNFGPTDEDVKPVSWILEKLTELWGDGASWEPDTSQHPHEALCLKLDCSKARNLLGWSPKMSLLTALEWTVEWYKNYQRNQDMRHATETDIRRFENLQNEE